ncbi:MAG: hypothetical protein EOO97_00290 [Pedobacter sp.]|nr:MAG: hypothetical protein EOO97_00290 [Pedobacter sp.]
MPIPKKKKVANEISPVPKLTIEIKNSRPVDLAALVDMFSGLNNGYNKYVNEHENFELNQETKLFVREVRKGSQIYELVQLAPLAIPFIENVNSIIEFGSHLKTAFDYLLGKSSEKPAVDSADLKNIAKVVEPIVKDNGAQLNLTATYQTNKITYNINYIEHPILDLTIFK